ncbi:hypothetical protein JOC70_000772 [Clostridium pascui]|uniref:hypothetical protein n=1 Tax=Clostridium pascui TaxID=46609 RepID=UPI001957E2D2|nr:hypothetical protein [Clostridium pascui]MBM7869303.1 hypothetical protein [Clostridium pascui]
MGVINREKISSKIYKQLERKGLLKSIKILRCDVNAFNEKVDNLYVCTIQAYYYRNDIKITIQSFEGASLNRGYEDKLLVSNSDESRKIRKDDYFILDGVKYKILDLGNVENIIFNMTLERM